MNVQGRPWFFPSPWRLRKISLTIIGALCVAGRRLPDPYLSDACVVPLPRGLGIDQPRYQICKVLARRVAGGGDDRVERLDACRHGVVFVQDHLVIEPSDDLFD